MRSLPRPLIAAAIVVISCAQAGLLQQACGAESSHPILAPQPRVPASTPRPLSMSRDTAARIASVVPKFVVQADPVPFGATLNPAPAQEQSDPAVVRLPRYIVEGIRVPKLKERELLTPSAKLKLAYKRHPGLRIGSLGPLSNHIVAREIVEEELALERKRELVDLLSLMPARNR